VSGFVPPQYPYERVDRFKPFAESFDGGLVDFSIGTPMDPAPQVVIDALGSSGAEHGYPPSIGTTDFREAAARWMGRRFDIDVPTTQIAACIGTKEFVGTLPQWLRLRTPERDTILYPAISYPTYEMGATLGGCRAVSVMTTQTGDLDLDSIDPADISRALALWVNSPANPSGDLGDLGRVADWGRANGVPVFSDECYVEFTWEGRGRSILEHGTDGVVAVHSLSKRSNLAGTRVGFYAGDATLVSYLREVRKHVGMMVPGPTQAAGVAALDDDAHVQVQRDRYERRLRRVANILGHWSGIEIPMPAGGFYLWFHVGDAWGFTERLARDAGALVSPGDFYGVAGSGSIRVAVVQPDERIELVASRLGVRMTTAQ
jgi:succinyldiaminopimelate transaminase